MGWALLFLGAASSFGCDDGSSGTACDPPDPVEVAPGPDLDLGAGVDSSSAEDLATLCSWSVDSNGGERCIACPDGNRTVSRSQCIAQVDGVRGCGLTIGDLVDCFGAFAGDPCNAADTDACAPVQECVF
jgi:hypothetical protein